MYYKYKSTSSMFLIPMMLVYGLHCVVACNVGLASLKRYANRITTYMICEYHFQLINETIWQAQGCIGGVKSQH